MLLFEPSFITQNSNSKGQGSYKLETTKLRQVLKVNSILINASKALSSYLLYKISSNSSDNLT
uniref:Phenylalanyl-tRNA synthetase, putative n=1 Tax=Arundo donax TaxID=35708 RepID=A0A0A9ANC0_ARUDO